MKDNIFTNDDAVVIVSYLAKYHIRSVLSGHYSEVSVILELDEILFSAPSFSCIMFCQGARPLCVVYVMYLLISLLLYLVTFLYRNNETCSVYLIQNTQYYYW